MDVRLTVDNPGYGLDRHVGEIGHVRQGSLGFQGFDQHDFEIRDAALPAASALFLLRTMGLCGLALLRLPFLAIRLLAGLVRPAVPSLDDSVAGHSWGESKRGYRFQTAQAKRERVTCVSACI